MLILSADTSGQQGSIALSQCEPQGSCRVLEVAALAGGTFSAQLVPQIATLLARHGFDKHDLRGFAVVSGPGSFTGLRVGLAAFKALADALAQPLAAVSLLEAVAIRGGQTGKVLAALDAGRKEIYLGEYELDGRANMLSERLLAPAQFLSIAAGAEVITPDESVADLGRQAGLQVKLVARPQSDVIAQLGWTKILAGETVSPETLDANYIRRSDAEIFAKPAI